MRMFCSFALVRRSCLRIRLRCADRCCVGVRGTVGCFTQRVDMAGTLTQPTGKCLAGLLKSEFFMRDHKVSSLTKARVELDVLGRDGLIGMTQKQIQFFHMMMNIIYKS